MPTKGLKEVTLKPTMFFICDIAVKRVYVDNESNMLFQDKADIVYKMLVFHKYDYPLETTMHAYGEKGTTTVNFYDHWDNSYTAAHTDQLGHYTWQ